MPIWVSRSCEIAPGRHIVLFSDFCRNGSLLCRNNATCINRPDLRDFACNCTDPYYGRFCENCSLSIYSFLLFMITILCLSSWIGISSIPCKFFQFDVTWQFISHRKHKSNNYQYHSRCSCRYQYHYQVMTCDDETNHIIDTLPLF